MGYRHKTECPVIADKRTKREQILDAAYTIFSNKGYHRATIDEIIDLADTGKGTVYNYFHNKEQLFYILVKERSAPFELAIQSVVTGKQPPLDKIRSLIRLYLQFYAANADLWRVLMHEMRGFSGSSGLTEQQRDKYRQAFRATIVLLQDAITEGIQEQVIRNCDPNKAAYGLFSVIMMMAFQKFAGTTPEDFERTASEVAETFFHGVATT
jgi:TetR/AcrR family transcriptional regulator